MHDQEEDYQNRDKEEDKRSDDGDEMEQDMHRLREIVVSHCHCFRVGGFMDLMELREQAVIRIATASKDVTAQLDARVSSTEADLMSIGPWFRSKSNEE